MIPHNRIYNKAVMKTAERDPHYGLSKGPEAWETMPIDSIASAIKYKVDRAIQPATSMEKRLDDIEDAYNYVAALYERMLKAGRIV
jgi:hypothetical protein